MRKRSFILCIMITLSLGAFAQGARNIKINEVQTKNISGPIDAYGEHKAWIELANTAFSTYNVRGMFITTDKNVLNKSLTVPQRESLMSRIPSGDEITNLSARQHILFYFNSSPSKGTQYLSTPIEEDKPQWIALYDGNAVDLLDSVTIPILEEDESYARKTDGSKEWVIRTSDAITPGTENFIQANETKISKLKRNDPHGFGITILSMGIVFGCLALLYIFFRLLGIFMSHKEALQKASKIQPIKAAVKTGEKIAETGHKTKVILKDGIETGGIDKEIYIAVISMALKQYQDDVHDIESGIITIRPKNSSWGGLLEKTIYPKRQ